MPDAKTMTLSTPRKGKLGLTSIRQRNFADVLGWAIAEYQISKDTKSPHEQLLSAYRLLDFIERGRTWGVIKDNTKLTDKVKECEEQNQRLKENQQKLETEILRLKVENENLHKALDKFGVLRTNVPKTEE